MAESLAGYWALFASAFGAATLLPMYSEAVLLSMAAAGYEVRLLWLFATVGNTLGAVVNWLIGRFSARLVEHPRLSGGRRQLARAQDWYARWGVWSLLLAWLPVGGDALTLIAGLMRVRLPLFVLLVGAGKGARYAVLLLPFIDW